jgi:hypothetical protein
MAVGVPLSGQARAATVAGTWPVGRAPLSLATDPATGKIYVANSETAMADGTGRISVVDPVTGSVSSLTTTLTANFVLVDGAARKLYSSNATYAADDTSVDIFDLDTGARTTIPGIGGLSLGLDAGAGRLFAAGGALTVIDTTTFEIKRTLPPPPFAAWFGVTVDPADRRVYLSNPAPNSQGIYAFDYNERDEITSAWANPVTPPTAVRFALAFDPLGRRLLAAGSDTSGGGAPSAFYAITPSGTIAGATTIAGFPNGIALAPGAHRIYVSTMTSQAARGAIYALDDAYNLTETVETPFAPGQPLIHTDGRLYVGNYVTVGDYTRFWAPDSTLKALDLANHAPVVSVALDPANPRTEQIVTATGDAYDADLRPMGVTDPTTRTYEWLRNGTVIPGQTGSSLDLKVAGNGDRDDMVTVRVTASDGQLTSTATASVTVANSAPTATVSLNILPKTNDVLVAATDAKDDDGDGLTYSYEWLRNGTVIEGQTGSSLNLAVPGNGDRGDRITVRVTASDGQLSSTATESVTVANTAPTAGVSLNQSAPKTNDALVATTSASDADGDALSYTYTWSVNGAVKRTATTSSSTDRFDLRMKGNGDKGDVVTVSVTVSDAGASSTPATASATVR